MTITVTDHSTDDGPLWKIPHGEFYTPIRAAGMEVSILPSPSSFLLGLKPLQVIDGLDQSRFAILISG